MLVALTSTAPTRVSTSFWVSGSFGTTFVFPTRTFAGGIQLDRTDQGMSTFFDFGVSLIDVRFGHLGNCWWNDFQARIQTGSGKTGIWHAGGIHFDFVDKGLCTFSDFRVVLIDIHFARLGNVLLERLSDGLAGCSPFEFRPRVGSPCWWYVACPRSKLSQMPFSDRFGDFDDFVT